MPPAVGRYRIDHVLGSGAFASIWLAQDEVLEAPVAIKVLAGGLIDDMDVRSRFLEEARILRRADSERLVRVHDIGELPDGRPYFVMSYADRGTLADRMKNRSLPLDEAMWYAVEVARGVAVVNRLGIIHRDLKPSNVLFQTTNDGDERLLIADLGLAKMLAHASGAFTLPVGTPGYMSPEQARFGGGLDVRADVYGLGALTYHLLTGRAPTTAPVKVPPSALRAGLSPAIDQAVMRALEVDRERRWPSAEAFATALSSPTTPSPSNSDMPSKPPAATTVVTPLPSKPQPPQQPPREATPQPPREAPSQPPREVPSQPPREASSQPPREAPSQPPRQPPRQPSHQATPQRPPQPAVPEDRTHVMPLPALPQDRNGQQPPKPGKPGKRRRLPIIVAIVVALVVLGGGGGAYLLTRSGGHAKTTVPAGFDTVTDASGNISVQVPKSWAKQNVNTWPGSVPITDRTSAPALRATPDYASFVDDAKPVPGVFIGLTHDLGIHLPPAGLGSHGPACSAGQPQNFSHGVLSGQITSWTCPKDSVTINEVGLRANDGKYALWIRIKLAGGPDYTRQILDSIGIKNG